MCTYPTLETKSQERKISSFLSSCHLWMTAGLGITAVIAWWLGHHAETMKAIFSSGWIWGLVISQFLLVILVSAFGNFAKKDGSPGIYALCAVGYLVFAAFEGVLVSSIFAAYPIATIELSFGVTALTFAGMSLYGYTTKADLTSMGSFCIMAVWGLIVAMIVNAFVGSSVMDYVISCVAVLIFCGLTAYDTQKLIAIAKDARQDDNMGLVAITGAMMLYLDFMNLFLHILRIFGGGSSTSSSKD